MSIGKKLKEIRKLQGLSQRDVSNKMGWSTPQFLSNWERDISLPSISCIPRLALIYNMSEYDLKTLIYKAKVDEYKKDLKAKLGL